MAYVGNPTKLPDGLAGLALRENRLLSQPIEYIDAEGVTFEDHHARKEAGAVSLDANGVAGAPFYQGTVSGAGDGYGAILARFAGSGIAAGGTSASTDVTTTGTTKTVTVPGGGYAQFSLVTVAIVMSSVTNTVTSVTDTQGNTYVAPASETAIGETIVDGRLKLYVSRIATALAAGNTITVTYSSLLSQGVIVVANFTGVTSATSTGTDTNGDDTTTVSAAGPLAPSAVPYLLVCGLGCSTSTFAPGASPVFIEAVELNGTNMTGAIHYRIDTSATAPTIIALHDWLSDVTSTGTGNAATTAGSTTVSGSGGTTFTTEVFEGDFIQIGTEIRKVETITDNDTLDTTEAWTNTNAAGAFTIRVGQRLIIASTEGSLFKERNGDLDAVALKSGLSTTARPGRFVQGGKEAAALARKLFYFNGVNVVQVLEGDGATTTDISNPPTDWATTNQPINGVIHRDRLVAWGNRNDPSRIYISDPDDHEDFTTPSATTQRVASNVGDRLIGGVSFNGVLWLFKYPRGIFYLEDTDLSVSNWAIFTKSEALGCTLSPYSVLPLDDDVLFMSADGSFHLLSAVNTLGGVKASDLSSALGIDKWLEENVNLSKLDQVTSVWYPSGQTAYFGVPGVGDTTNTLTLKFDFSGVAQDQPTKFSYSRRDNPDALAVQRDEDGVERPLLGESGFVYRLDQADRNKDGIGYTASLQSPHLDFSHVDPSLEYKRKVWDALELVMEPVSAGTITVQVYVDTVLKETLSYDATVRRQRKTLHVGDGYMLSIKVTNSTVDEDFRILSRNVFFTVGNEDYSRAV